MDELSPVYRVEHFLDAIVNGSVNPYSPMFPIEYYLAKIAGESVEIPVPISRVDHYLAQLCGDPVELPAPVSRIDRYLAAICGEDVDIPAPVHRVEFWLAKWAEGGAGIVSTVTGVSPLLLTSAIAHSIKSLTQYGLCAQSGSPTPAAAVAIKLNNGSLQMVDDELPNGYKRLLGLTFSNNVYYAISGFKMRGNDTLRFSFKCSMASPACNVLGAYDGSSAQSNYSLYLGNSTSAKYLRYNGGTYRSDADSDTQYDVVITPTGATGMKADSSWTAKTFESDGDLCIGTTSPTASSSKMVGDIIGNIVVDGRLKLIPCERVSDNVLGYYDTVGETFYEPTGSGVVSMGYDGSRYELAVVGTSEVLTVSADGAETQTVTDIPMLLSVGDYADEAEIISGGVTRRVGIKVLDGTETWTTDTYGGYRRMVLQEVLNASGDTLPVLCSHFVSRAADARQQPNSIFIASSGKLVIYVDSTQNISTVEEFNAWLAVTHVIVIYPLTEETTETVTGHTLHTAEGTNTVEVAAEVDDMTLKVEYTVAAA